MLVYIAWHIWAICTHAACPSPAHAHQPAERSSQIGRTIYAHVSIVGILTLPPFLCTSHLLRTYSTCTQIWKLHADRPANARIINPIGEKGHAFHSRRLESVLCPGVCCCHPHHSATKKATGGGRTGESPLCPRAWAQLRANRPRPGVLAMYVYAPSTSRVWIIGHACTTPVHGLRYPAAKD
jgi:hypothetical protein